MSNASRLSVLRRRTAGLLTAALAAAVLAGCGGSSDDAAPPSRDGAPGVVTTAPDGVQEITLETGDDYVFTPDAFTVTPGQVRLTLTNTADQLTHNLAFTAGAGPADIPEEITILPPGTSETITFTVEAPGDYPFTCTFHTALGQVGTMTVSAG